MAVRRLFVPAILGALLVPAGVRAQQTATSLPAGAREYLQESQEIQKLFAAKQYQKAADACAQVLKNHPTDSVTLYNLACADAHLNKPDEALDALEKSVKNGFADADHLEQDGDLASLHQDKKFAQIVAQAKANFGKNVRYEPGENIPSVKTVEAFPDGGLRYRLRIPKNATPEKPAPLIIWLHPSGGSMNQTVEKLSPDLAAHGYALMVCTQKQFMGWTLPEITQLMTKTLADVKTHKEIDASRPILMGFSAGGQVAIDLWQQNPGAFAGLILDAAYPLIVKDRHYVPMELPSDTAKLKKTAIHVLVGGNDPGSKIWQKIENKWLDAGVPLTVVVVPEKAHGWLLTGAALKGAYAWLDQLAAGKHPADAPESQTRQSATTQPAPINL